MSSTDGGVPGGYAHGHEDFQTFVFGPYSIRILEKMPQSSAISPLFSDEWTGSQVWEASKVLCQFMTTNLCTILSNPETRVIELGSGCGLCGILAALMGASATLTDQLSLVEHLKQNVDLNCHESRVTEVREHTWGEDVARLDPPFDIVLISDCVNTIYGSTSWRRLADSIKSLSSFGTQVYMTHQLRGGDEAFHDFIQYSSRWFAIDEILDYESGIQLHKLQLLKN